MNRTTGSGCLADHGEHGRGCPPAAQITARLRAAQVILFGELGATLATSFKPFASMGVTDDPVVLLMVCQEGGATGGDHCAPALWEVTAPASNMQRWTLPGPRALA